MNYTKIINAIKKESYNYFIFSYGINVYISNPFRFIAIDCVDYINKIQNKNGMPPGHELHKLEQSKQGFTYNKGCDVQTMDVAKISETFKKMMSDCYNSAYDTFIETRKPGEHPIRYIASDELVTATNADIWQTVTDCCNNQYYVDTAQKQTDPIKLVCKGLIYVSLPIRICEHDSLPQYIKNQYCNQLQEVPA